MRLKIARVELKRGGLLPSKDFSEQEVLNTRSNALPLGPLHMIRINRNLLLLEMIPGGAQLDPVCVLCNSRINPQETAFTCCECVIICFRTCVQKSVAINQMTFRQHCVQKKQQALSARIFLSILQTKQ